MPILHLTVTGIATAVFIAAMQAATSAGSATKAGPKPPLLHPIRRTTDIEVDFVVADILTNFGGRHQIARIGAAELKRHGMFARIKREQPLPVATQDAPPGQHSL